MMITMSTAPLNGHASDRFKGRDLKNAVQAPDRPTHTQASRSECFATEVDPDTQSAPRKTDWTVKWKCRLLGASSRLGRPANYPTPLPQIPTGTRPTATVTSTIPTRFNTIPARTICPIVIAPEPNTIAFGGVATGSMNA
jgi:hypothetical protein